MVEEHDIYMYEGELLRSAMTMCTLQQTLWLQVRDKKATTIDVHNTIVPCTALHTSKRFQGLQQHKQECHRQKSQKAHGSMSFHGGSFCRFYWLHVVLPAYTVFFTVLEIILISTVLTCLEESEPNMFHCCTILIYLVHVTAAYDITLLFTCNVFSMILQ